jgi:hypothetical protein
MPAEGSQVERPPPGPARGLWEAPAWAIALLGAAVTLAGVVWLVRRVRGRRRDA